MTSTSLPLPAIAYKNQEEVHTEPLLLSLDQALSKIEENSLSWRQGRTSTSRTPDVGRQRVKGMAHDILGALEVRSGQSTDLSSASHRWATHLSGVVQDHSETQDPVSPIEDQITGLSLAPRAPHRPRVPGINMHNVHTAEHAMGRVAEAGSKILNSVSESIIPSAYADEPPPYHPPKETQKVRFDDVWVNYEYLKRPEWMGNGCAVNMSHALLASGAPNMKAQKRPTGRVEDESLLFRLRDLDAYLQKNNIGTPTKISDPEELNGRRGIVYFKGDFGDATGHATLWNGRSFHPNDHCCQFGCDHFFYTAEAVYFYEFPQLSFE